MPCDDKCGCAMPCPGGAACGHGGQASSSPVCREEAEQRRRGGAGEPRGRGAHHLHLRRALLLQAVLLRPARLRRRRRQGRLHLRPHLHLRRLHRLINPSD
ncbi:uncharacterized protein [Triticum aestivum]|uniref:uncharacterized protein isoform X1 n=1 Tax=Triticum aestivum TaxID=4565 RepID=UPI001D034FA7|nr:uncharacterized protein LOC123093592 isoform X1 [Triticum aestivum]